MFDQKDSQGWLLKLKDYISGRTPELDGVWDWVEKQTCVITESDLSRIPLEVNDMSVIESTPKEVSRQLWALLAGLVGNHAETMLMFRNIERHNGVEAWRRIAEPITQGRDLRRKQFQPKEV